MKMRLLLAGICCLSAIQNYAQQKSNVKFGKVAIEDFNQKIYPIDSSANAVVIADIGSTEFVGNTKGSFSLEFNKFRRMHIINKNGYDAAKVVIGIYANGDREEQLDDLKAYTYNVENGKIVETKLETKSEVFKDKVSKNLVLKKFTFPNIKEGSIIEYQYKIHSDFTFNLQPWEFQGEYPCLWSEYNVAMPEFYKYVSLSQGHQNFFIRDKEDKSENFYVIDPNGTEASQRINFNAGITKYRWVMKDVPALKEESYTSTINNHISRIEFQLQGLDRPFTPKDVMGTWKDACADLLKDEDFGHSLSRDNPWLNDVMGDAKKGAKTDMEKAKNIFEYVRDNMTCTNYNRKYLEHPLKTVLKAKNGSEAEINLLLTAMLLKAGLTAEPVLLSTRSHGYTYALYPLLDRFNYVITRLSIDGKEYFLDASHSKLGFGKLTYETYNLGNDNFTGHARVVNDLASPLDFIPDSLNEAQLSSIIIINDDKGNLNGRMTQSPGYLGSYSLRNRVQEKGKEFVFNDIKKGFNADIEIQNPEIEELNNYDIPVKINYDFLLKKEDADIIYMNPMFSEAWKENPFKSAVRQYPVEMPYPIDETYLLRMDVPAGYVIDELPKQVMVKLNDVENSYFEYVMSESDGAISMRSRIRLERTMYAPDEYEMLREFFNLVVKKHNEQIVFKKKK